MKYSLVFLLLICFAHVSHGQDVVKAPPSIFKYVEQMPSFKGDLTTWMRNNLRYPSKAKKEGKEGRVVVEFVVTETGNITDPKIVRSSGTSDLDKEALRLVKMMPDWQPGKNNGVPIKCYYTVPVSFRLE